MTDQVEEVKQKTDIVSVIGEHIELKKAGRNFKANCPFHSERTPSFMVSPELQIYKCFGCFPANQIIKTPFGYHKIKNITSGEYVVSGGGNIQEVEGVLKRDYKGDLIKIKLACLRDNVRLTGDHVVYVVGGSPLYKYQYKYLSRKYNKYHKYNRSKRLARMWRYTPIEKVQARELRKGMTLLYPVDSTVVELNNLDLSDYISKKWPPHGTKPTFPNLNILVDDNLLKLVGYYVAEGSNHRAYIRFSLGNHEEAFAKEIVEIVSNIFNIDAKIHRRRRGKTGIEVTACNSVLANMFENLCGKGAQNKHIPFIFQQLTLTKQEVLLNAIFKGDGYERLANKAITLRREISTVSRVLAEQLTDILLRLGYYPSRSVQKAKTDRHGVRHKEAFTVGWSVDPHASRYKHIYKDREGNKYWLLPIAHKSTSNFEGEVYNLRVRNENSYVANTFSVANCGESGDVISFIEKYEGMEFYEVLKYLADKVGVKLKPTRFRQQGEKEKLYQINSFAAKFYEYILLKHKAGKVALSYLTSQRGLSLETIKKFRLGYSPDVYFAIKSFLVDKKGFVAGDLEKSGLAYKTQRGYIDRFRGRVVFPLFDHRGNVSGFAGRILPTKKKLDLAKYINTPETPVYHKSNLLYGLSITKSEIKKKGKAVVVEGELDLISSYQAGIKNIIALKGSAFTEGQARLLGRFAQKIILSLDADIAGDAAARRGISIAEEAGLEVSVVKLVGYKDPDDIARKDPVLYKKLLSKPIGVWDYIVDSTFEKYDISTGVGKSKVSKDLIPVLAIIPDDIVKAHYVEKTAKKLNVPTEAVVRQILKVKDFEKKTVAGESGITKEPSKTRREILEERFLALLLQGDPNKLIKKGTASLIKGTFIKSLFEEMKKFKKINKWSPKKFATALPNELRTGFNNMFLNGSVLVDKGGISVEKEVDLVLSELKILEIKEKLNKLTNEIRNLELQKKAKLLTKKQKEFAKLTNKLSDLEENKL